MSITLPIITCRVTYHDHRWTSEELEETQKFDVQVLGLLSPKNYKVTKYTIIVKFIFNNTVKLKGNTKNILC